MINYRQVSAKCPKCGEKKLIYVEYGNTCEDCKNSSSSSRKNEAQERLGKIQSEKSLYSKSSRYQQPNHNHRSRNDRASFRNQEDSRINSSQKIRNEFKRTSNQHTSAAYNLDFQNNFVASDGPGSGNQERERMNNNQNIPNGSVRRSNQNPRNGSTRLSNESPAYNPSSNQNTRNRSTRPSNPNSRQNIFIPSQNSLNNPPNHPNFSFLYGSEWNNPSNLNQNRPEFSNQDIYRRRNHEIRQATQPGLFSHEFRQGFFAGMQEPNFENFFEDFNPMPFDSQPSNLQLYNQHRHPNSIAGLFEFFFNGMFDIPGHSRVRTRNSNLLREFFNDIRSDPLFDYNPMRNFFSSSHFSRLGIDEILQNLHNMNPRNDSAAPQAPRVNSSNISDVKVTKDLIKENPICTVCQEDFKINEIIKKIRCQHSFHKDCIMPWLNIKNTCPTCRKTM